MLRAIQAQDNGSCLLSKRRSFKLNRPLKAEAASRTATTGPQQNPTPLPNTRFTCLTQRCRQTPRAALTPTSSAQFALSNSGREEGSRIQGERSAGFSAREHHRLPAQEGPLEPGQSEAPPNPSQSDHASHKEGLGRGVLPSAPQVAARTACL